MPPPGPPSAARPSQPQSQRSDAAGHGDGHGHGYRQGNDDGYHMGRDDGWKLAQHQGLSYGSQGLPLGSAHAWQDNQYSILPCGHTHNEVDWMFSLLARVLHGRGYFTMEGMSARK